MAFANPPGASPPTTRSLPYPTMRQHSSTPSLSSRLPLRPPIGLGAPPSPPSRMHRPYPPPSLNLRPPTSEGIASFSLPMPVSPVFPQAAPGPPPSTPLPPLPPFPSPIEPSTVNSLLRANSRTSGPRSPRSSLGGASSTDMVRDGSNGSTNSFASGSSHSSHIRHAQPLSTTQSLPSLVSGSFTSRSKKARPPSVQSYTSLSDALSVSMDNLDKQADALGIPITGQGISLISSPRSKRIFKPATPSTTRIASSAPSPSIASTLALSTQSVAGPPASSRRSRPSVSSISSTTSITSSGVSHSSPSVLVPPSSFRTLSSATGITTRKTSVRSKPLPILPSPQEENETELSELAYFDSTPLQPQTRSEQGNVVIRPASSNPGPSTSGPMARSASSNLPSRHTPMSSASSNGQSSRAAATQTPTLQMARATSAGPSPSSTRASRSTIPKLSSSSIPLPHQRALSRTPSPDIEFILATTPRPTRSRSRGRMSSSSARSRTSSLQSASTVASSSFSNLPSNSVRSKPLSSSRSAGSLTAMRRAALGKVNMPPLEMMPGTFASGSIHAVADPNGTSPHFYSPSSREESGTDSYFTLKSHSAHKSGRGSMSSLLLPSQDDITPRGSVDDTTPPGTADAPRNNEFLHWSEDSEGEGTGGSESESSIDMVTPLPHLLVRQGLLSPSSTVVQALDPKQPPTKPSSIITTNPEIRKRRHRDGKLLREGIGLTTGLGWSDSEDEGKPGPLRKRLSQMMLRRSTSTTSINSYESNSRPSSGIMIGGIIGVSSPMSSRSPSSSSAAVDSGRLKGKARSTSAPIGPGPSNHLISSISSSPSALPPTEPDRKAQEFWRETLGKEFDEASEAAPSLVPPESTSTAYSTPPLTPETLGRANLHADSSSQSSTSRLPRSIHRILSSPLADLSEEFIAPLPARSIADADDSLTAAENAYQTSKVVSQSVGRQRAARRVSSATSLSTAYSRASSSVGSSSRDSSTSYSSNITESGVRTPSSTTSRLPRISGPPSSYNFPTTGVPSLPPPISEEIPGLDSGSSFTTGSTPSSSAAPSMYSLSSASASSVRIAKLSDASISSLSTGMSHAISRSSAHTNAMAAAGELSLSKQPSSPSRQRTVGRDMESSAPRPTMVAMELEFPSPPPMSPLSPHSHFTKAKTLPKSHAVGPALP